MADENHIIPAEARTAVARREGRSIGALLVDEGRLRIQDAEAILRLQREKNLRFGDAALQLGLLSQADIDYALARQFDLPYLLPGQSGVSEEVVAAYTPSAPAVEGMRALRGQLMLRWFDGESTSRSLAIVSAERKDGRSFIAANLAVVFAQLGQRTLLIDADLRAPRQHEIFGLDGRAGLSTILAGRAGEELVQQLPVLSTLSVLVAGPVPPNPAELLSRPQFPELLRQLEQRYEVILLDTPASSESSDAQMVAVRAGGALIVVRRNSARTWRVEGVSEQVTEARATLIGAVLNSY